MPRPPSTSTTLNAVIVPSHVAGPLGGSPAPVGVVGPPDAVGSVVAVGDVVVEVVGSVFGFTAVVVEVSSVHGCSVVTVVDGGVLVGPGCSVVGGGAVTPR